MNNLYGFIQKPEVLNLSFIGLVDLSSRSIILALSAGVLQFIYSKMVIPKKNINKKLNTKGFDFSSVMNQQMLYFMPIITVIIALNLPAALPLYWIVITVFNIIQQYFTPVPKEPDIKLNTEVN